MGGVVWVWVCGECEECESRLLGVHKVTTPTVVTLSSPDRHYGRRDSLRDKDMLSVSSVVSSVSGGWTVDAVVTHSTEKVAITKVLGRADLLGICIHSG